MVVILQYTTNSLFCVPVFGLNTIMEIITEAGPVSNEGGFLASWAVHDISTPSKHPCACLFGETFFAGNQYHMNLASHSPITHSAFSYMSNKKMVLVAEMHAEQPNVFCLSPSALVTIFSLSLSHSHYCFLPMYDAIIHNMLLLFSSFSICPLFRVLADSCVSPWFCPWTEVSSFSDWSLILPPLLYR